MLSPHYSDHGGRSAVRLRRSCFAVDELGLQHVAARPIAAAYAADMRHRLAVSGAVRVVGGLVPGFVGSAGPPIDR